MTDKRDFCIKFKNMLTSVCHNHFQIVKKLSGGEPNTKELKILDKLIEDFLSPTFLLGIDREIKDVMKSADVTFDEFKTFVTEHERTIRQRNRWYYEQEFLDDTPEDRGRLLE